MIQAGDSVQVIDQSLPADGVVVEVSDWTRVTGGPPGGGACYKVRCTE